MKILVWFLVLSIPPVIGITVVSYLRSKSLIEKQLAELLESTAEMVSRDIRHFISTKKSRLVGFSSDGLIRDGLLVIGSGEPGGEAIVERLNRHLSINKLPLDADIDEISVVDLSWRVVASTNETKLGVDISKSDCVVQGCRHGIYVCELHHNDALNKPTLCMSRIMTNLRTGNPIGMMVLTISGDALSRITSAWNVAKDDSASRFRGLGHTGEVYIVNEDRLMVTESRFVENAVLKQVVDIEPVEMAFSTAEESSRFYSDYQGNKVLGTARLIDEMRWVVVAEKHSGEVFEPIMYLKKIGFVLVVVDAVVVIIIAFFITRSMTKPIHQLVAATKKVAKGDLDTHVLSTPRDEIGHLSSSFNKMTQDLKRKSGELRALFDDGVDPMFVLSAGESISHVNNSACALLGRERKALVGTKISKLIGFDDTAADSDKSATTEASHMVIEAIKKTWALEDGEKFPTLDVSLTNKEGAEVLCELELKRTEHGLFAEFRDVTGKKHLEQEILDEKQKLDNIVTQIGAGLSLVDKDKKIIWVNNVLSNWFGGENVLGRECFRAYWNSEGVCPECPSREALRTGTIQKSIHSHTTPDGKNRWYRITSSPMKNHAGRVTHTLELIEDITEERKAQEEFQRLHESVLQTNIKLEQSIKDLKLTQQQLIQSEKMASMGQLAASVAHEINNPLSYIDNNLDVLNRYSERIQKFLKKCEDGKPIFDNGQVGQIESFFKEVQDLKTEIKLDIIMDDFMDVITESLSGTERIKSIVSNLGLFSHVGEEVLKYVNLNSVIDGILVVVWGEVKYKAEVIKEYGEIPDVPCYPQQLGQVFMNLLTNASHAMEGKRKGRINIKTYNTGGEVCVEIKDNGKGIPENIQSRIFEPFITTKEPGKGTGLGLSVSYNIIQKHSGRIEVSSEVGKGTTFTIALPIKS